MASFCRKWNSSMDKISRILDGCITVFADTSTSLRGSAVVRTGSYVCVCVCICVRLFCFLSLLFAYVTRSCPWKQLELQWRIAFFVLKKCSDSQHLRSISIYFKSNFYFWLGRNHRFHAIFVMLNRTPWSTVIIHWYQINRKSWNDENPSLYHIQATTLFLFFSFSFFYVQHHWYDWIFLGLNFSWIYHFLIVFIVGYRNLFIVYLISRWTVPAL